MLDALFEDAASAFGIPLVLRRAILKHGNAAVSSWPSTSPCIASDSVVNWGHLSKGFFLGHVPPAAARRVVVTDTVDWRCDIRQVEGLSASKSRLESFGTLDEFAQTSCTAQLAKGLDACLQHCTSRIVSSDRYPMSVAQWDGRVFLENSDGSHHFAAARRIAGREHRRIELRARVRRSFFDATAVEALRRQYEVFAVRGHGAFYLWEALQRFRVRIEQTEAPRQLGENTVLWFLRSTPRTEKAAALLRKTGALDVGKYFEELARRPLPLEPGRPAA